MSQTITQSVPLKPSRSARTGAVRRLGRNRAAVLSFAVVLIFALLAILSPVITPYDPNVGNVVDSLVSPSSAHWLGTDDLGRDVLSRVIDASKIAMTVSLLSVGIALVIGLVLGVIAGYSGGPVDGVINRSQDVLFAFPELLLAIIIVAVMGPSLLNASFAISLLYIPRFVRLSRSATLQIKTSEFLDAARLAGVRPLRILWTHVVPNVFPSVIVLAALSMSTAQLAYASLAFLGLGVSPPQADWGGMLSTGRNFITVAPWMVLGPSVAVVALVLAFNVLGDAVRDELDPRSESTRGAGVPTV
jgi:ABC-type dipeptide/oligopeptide/nickel transport system permease subunit